MSLLPIQFFLDSPENDSEQFKEKFKKSNNSSYYSRLRYTSRLKILVAILWTSGSFAQYQSLIGLMEVNRHYK